MAHLKKNLFSVSESPSKYSKFLEYQAPPEIKTRTAIANGVTQIY